MVDVAGLNESPVGSPVTVALPSAFAIANTMSDIAAPCLTDWLSFPLVNSIVASGTCDVVLIV